MKKYLISEDGSSITCLKCGLTSFNSFDVKEKYCGHCSVFHDEKSWDDHGPPTVSFLILEKAEKIRQLCKEILG